MALTGASAVQGPVSGATSLGHRLLIIPYTILQNKSTFRIFDEIITAIMTTKPPKLERIQTGHLTTYLVSITGKITEKAVPLCFYFKVSILIKSFLLTHFLL